MADTAEIVRLMRHAADRLAEQDVQEILPPGISADRRRRAASMAMTMTYAEAILRTVAAALAGSDEPGPSDPGSSVVPPAAPDVSGCEPTGCA